jgi:hypothetical protein
MVTDSVLAIRVESSTLPTRAKNVLKRLGCETIVDVAKLTDTQILRSKWAGKKVLFHIKLWLDSYGLSLIEPAAKLPSPVGFPLLNGYFQLQRQIFDYFGYVENWIKIPLRDNTDAYWLLQENENGGGMVTYAPEELTPALLDRENPGRFNSDSIYMQRFLPRWVSRGKDFTMVCVDTHTDGNKFLAVFSNSKEATPTTQGAQYRPLCEAVKSWDLWGDLGESVLASVDHDFSIKG